MDFLDFLPLIEGSFSIINVVILLQIAHIKREIDREKAYFLKFMDEEKHNNKNLDTRLKKLEIQAARRWSTWRE